ncbi:MAG TPA: cysteine--tRNA ligase [Longimicrobiales bacterium]|nr:cysteine--tRNA ligase [Longimicrobiales bacterium]
MALRFYDTLSRELRDFEPREPGRVGLYACGPTVYQLPHIGNYRTFLFNDILHRWLEWKGFEVRFIMNLTDVDDRIIEKAAAAGVRVRDYTDPFIRGFMEELEILGVRAADEYPRATESIEAMADLVERLLARGHAYRTDAGIFFDISSFPAYGRLSRIPLDEVRTGERVADDRYEKADARDFALWKAPKPADEEVGAVWDGPAVDGARAPGRPGWHLECSAMSMSRLGDTFDIHTGGEDLIFPHHEDEIAQSEGATGTTFVRYWLHARHLMMDTEKMSKSLGNVVGLRDVLDRGYAPAVVRFLLVSAHYRKELSFSWDALDDARAALRRVADFQDRLSVTPVDPLASRSPLPAIAARALEAFETALDDDLNTPAALAALFTCVRETNAALDRAGAVRGEDLATARDALASIDDVLGVLSLAAATAPPDHEIATWVRERLEARQQARMDRDFARADAIREEIAAAGIIVEDTPQGPRWKLDDAVSRKL